MVSQRAGLFEYQSTAIVSPCGRYRYELRRRWHPTLPALYVGCLNPSTADATTDDHTVRKLVGFAERLGLGGLVLWNLYAFRATDPRELWRCELEGGDPVGPDNDRHLARIFGEADVDRDGRFVVAWGDTSNASRVTAVLERMANAEVLTRLEAWGTTRNGGPRHPSRIGYDTPLTRWPVAV